MLVRLKRLLSIDSKMGKVDKALDLIVIYEKDINILLCLAYVSHVMLQTTRTYVYQLMNMYTPNLNGSARSLLQLLLNLDYL